MVIVRFIFVFTSLLFAFAIGYTKGMKEAYKDCANKLKNALLDDNGNVIDYDSENQA